MYKNIRRTHFKILSGRINVAELRNRLSLIWRNSKRTKTKLVYGKTMFQLEPCADVIMSVPGAGQFWLAAAAGRRSQNIGGGAALTAKKCFFKDYRKHFVLSPTLS